MNNLDDNCPADYWKTEPQEEEYEIDLEEYADEEKRLYMNEINEYD